MPDNSTSNKRIAKNTLFLYFRTFIIMIISLYTSRAILEALGETDFGIYNLVGGIVVLFSFMNSAMTSATQRFLNYELGKGNTRQVKRVFSMSLTAHICIAFLILILGETIGLWLVLTQLNIPLERYEASIWVYHLSLAGCCANILRIPYNACIIAYERMSFYAFVSIIESLLKLGIVFLLAAGLFDKLIVYAFLMLMVIIIVNVIYFVFCRKKFEITSYFWFWDKELFYKLLSFSGWSMFGSIATTAAGQGSSILLNIFHGVSLNAALGLSHQVHSAVASFVGSFQTAFSPQIVKTYAANQHTEFTLLICRSSRLSYCLVFVVALPLMVCINTVLHVWLTIVPDYTAEFVVLTVINCMVDALSGPLWVSVQATGNIRKYQILISFLILSNLPLMCLCLFMGMSPIIVVGVRTFICLVTHFVRIGYLQKIMEFPTSFYMKDVMLRVSLMTLFALPISLSLLKYTDGFVNTLIVFVVLLMQNLLLAWFVGVKNNERRTILQMVKQKIYS